MRFLTLALVFLLALPSLAAADTYYVDSGQNKVDGNTFCDGKCTSEDKIVIRAGQRDHLYIKDFDGNGEYIVITNEDTVNNIPVTITNTIPNKRGLHVFGCKWIKLLGNGDPEVEYGIVMLDELCSEKPGLGICSY